MIREKLEDLWYDLLYKLKLPIRLYHKVVKFVYYGYYGAKYCRDYDGNGGYTLLYAHIKRVRNFMDSDKTHLLWNSQKGNTGLIRKLYELEELLRRHKDDELESRLQNFRATLDKYEAEIGPRNALSILELGANSKIRKELRLASKKDHMIGKQSKERLDLLISKYLGQFWD